ncbi:MAG: DUF1178 family protein [Pseudomonadota bacterium]
MIRYTLKCENDHDFESWFRSSEAFETLSKAGQVTCGHCGSAKVEKAIMAPAVSGTKKKSAQTPAPVAEDAPLSTPSNPAETALRQMREHLKKNSDYVGTEFASEARKMHDGETDQRSIWGEATVADAKSLHEDGVPVAPLPFISRQDD